MARTELLIEGDHTRLALLKEQIKENFRSATAASVAGIFNAVIATIALWQAANAVLLGLWLGAILVGAAARVWVMRRGKTVEQTLGHFERQKLRVEAIALFNGSVWGLGAAAMAFVASPSQLVLLVILTSGMMGASVTTYTSLARAGALFIVPLAIGGLTMLVVHPVAPTLPATLFLTCYLILLVRGGYKREHRFAARIKGKEHLRETTETIKLLLNDFESQSADWLWQVDAQGRILSPSDRFGEVAGRGPSVLGDMYFLDLFDDSKERHMLEQSLTNKHGFRNLTLALTIDGAPHWWTLSAQPIQSGGMRGMASDITAQRRAEERVSYMAHYDGLTDLANRFLFNDTLKRAIKRAGSANDVAVLCLDLDSFKSVNDTLGHPTGDKLLCKTARRVEAVVGPDTMVARLGGDEFAVLITAPDAYNAACKVADKIIEAVAEPCLIDGSQVVSSTSIGIAWLQNSNRDADDLMKQADLALYAAKANGRNRSAAYETGMDEAAQERRALEMDLRAALAKNEFELVYQPLVNIESGQTVAYEALLRWHHPERGLVMPDDFIPIAEDTGLIVQLGEWVIREATREVSLWPEHLRVSVNLSPVQMRSANLIGTVFNAVANAQIDPCRLEIEITENVLLNDSDVNIATLHKLRDFGVRIALDDFGTGYSSLNYLRSFPFDKIKIDRCFVTDLDDNPECQAIVEAVTALATNLGMQTTAEGVEGEDQLQRLKNHGCTEAQGFLFSRPEAAGSFTDLRPASGSDAAVRAVTHLPARSNPPHGSNGTGEETPDTGPKHRKAG